MLKVVISLLLAGAAASPALAAPDSWSDRQQAREERQQTREERQQAREERQQVSREARQVSADRPAFGRAERAEPQFDARSQRDAPRESFAGARSDRRQQVQEGFEQRRDELRDARELRQSARRVPPVMRNPVPVISDTPRPGTQPPLRAESRRSPMPQWSSNWRHDSKYDWYNYRNRHRSLFRLGFYFDPFGWSYYPYQIGWRLWPSYYSSRYWISDPWQYRLPYAPAGYRWVRYWDDAVLVDTWSGQVVDVIYNFFW